MNIPYTYPAWKFQAELDAEGLQYDYLHFPKDSRKGRNRGFAFVNFATAEAAQVFRDALHNRLLAYPGDREKHVTVVPSSLQSFERNAKLRPFAARGQVAKSRQSQRKGGKTGLAGTAHPAHHAVRCATIFVHYHAINEATAASF